MSEPMFSVGFGPDQPTPQELDSLPVRQAVLTGVAKGIGQAATSTAQDRLNTAEGAANDIVDAALAPANDAVANLTQLQSAISAVGHQTALRAIQGPLKVGMALGYRDQGTPVLGPPRRGKRASGKSNAGVQPDMPELVSTAPFGGQLAGGGAVPMARQSGSLGVQGSTAQSQVGGHQYITAAGGQGYTTQPPPPPPPPPPLPPPPPPPPLTGGGYCRPTAGGGQICYTAGGRIISKAPPPPPPPPPQPPPPPPPFFPPPPPPYVPPPPPPPMPPPSPPPMSPPITGGGGGGGLGGPPCPGALGPYQYPPPVAAASGDYVVHLYDGYWVCPGGGTSVTTASASPPPFAPPPPPPAGGSTSATQCPTTYTIVRGPSCPTFFALPGSPASWAAQGATLPGIFTVVQTLTDTQQHVQTIVNNMSTICIQNALKQLGGK